MSDTSSPTRDQIRPLTFLFADDGLIPNNPALPLVIFRKAIEASEDPDATRAEMIEGIRKTIDPYVAAGNALIDDVIDPRETRRVVIRALEMAATKRVERPWKKHGVMPV